jgi:hypothetical protein
MPACVTLSRHRQSSNLQACTSNSCATLLENAHPFLSIPYPRSRARASPDVPRLQCYLHIDRVSRAFCILCAVVFADPSLSVELQSSRIRTRPEFPALVVTGSWAPLHTSRAGSSGYSASFLAMRSSTLIIVVGASVSIYGFDVIEDWTYRRLHLGRPLILPIYLSSPAFNFVAMSSTTTSAFSSTLLLGISLRQLERGPPFGRGLAARCTRRDVLSLCAEPSNYRDAPPARRPGPCAVTLVLQS